MPTEMPQVAIDPKEDIFNLLKQNGPLCISQVVVELGLPPKKVYEALHSLKVSGLVELRPDRNQSLNGDDTPWGLSRPSWFRRRKQ
jgi:Mn-dependent DtxR family transcriptional regulator